MYHGDWTSFSSARQYTKYSTNYRGYLTDKIDHILDTSSADSAEPVIIPSSSYNDRNNHLNSSSCADKTRNEASSSTSAPTNEIVDVRIKYIPVSSVSNEATTSFCLQPCHHLFTSMLIVMIMKTLFHKLTVSRHLLKLLLPMTTKLHPY